MNPKGLAPTRRMKKGGRAAVIPLGEVNKPVSKVDVLRNLDLAGLFAISGYSGKASGRFFEGF